MGRTRRTVCYLGLALVAAAASCTSNDAPSEQETSSTVTPTVFLTIESWRLHDRSLWESDILPVFEAKNPQIDVVFAPSESAQYDSEVEQRLEENHAGDLISCRPFDRSANLFQLGYLEQLDRTALLGSFDEDALAAWTSDDGQQTFCVPIASVLHGFLYNTEIFAELGLSVPETVAEFDRLLDEIEATNTVVPLAIGAQLGWELATMGFQSIGPTYWKGEVGRQELLSGTARLTDREYVSVFEQLASWGPHIPLGAGSMIESEAQQLFAGGEAAIYPAGSWEITGFDAVESLSYAAFPPPTLTEGGACYVSDHTDIGLGLNADSPHPEAARLFLQWVASAEFAELYSDTLPGFFSLRSKPIEYRNDLAQEFVSWRDECETTIRNSAEILSRGSPLFEEEIWRVTREVVLGEMDPTEASTQLQAGLDQWFQPNVGN